VRRAGTQGRTDSSNISIANPFALARGEMKSEDANVRFFLYCHTRSDNSDYYTTFPRSGSKTMSYSRPPSQHKRS
jgi:hypothetical protein